MKKLLFLLIISALTFGCREIVGGTSPKDHSKEELIQFSDFHELRNAIQGLHFAHHHAVYPGMCLQSKELTAGQFSQVQLKSEPFACIYDFSSIPYISAPMENNLLAYTNTHTTASQSEEFRRFMDSGKTKSLHYQSGVVNLEEDKELYDTLKAITGTELLKRKKSFVAIRILEAFTVTTPALTFTAPKPSADIEYINGITYGDITYFIVQDAKNLSAIADEYALFVKGKASKLTEKVIEGEGSIIIKNSASSAQRILSIETLRQDLESLHGTKNEVFVPIFFNTSKVD